MKAKHVGFVGVSLVVTLVVLVGILYVGQAETVDARVAPEITSELASMDVTFPAPLSLDCRPCTLECGAGNVLQCHPCICKLY